MAISRCTTKTIAISVLSLLLCSITIQFYLWSKYVNIGYCASIVYYHPISIKDILIMTLICIGWYCLSVAIIRERRKVFLIAEGVVYVILLLVFSLGGNTILENRKIHWPTEYHPQPIEKEIQQSTINQISD